MNDTMDSFESSMNDMKSITSNKRLSRVFPMDFEENDDTQEKKAQNKRNSAMLELGLIRNNKTRPKECVKSAFSSDEITNHYGDCMKLASENKITSKNAFDLHLIDYLQDYMHSLQSFQVVSSSLDAGAKIYAGRVDLVHTSTYHILTGCSTDSNGDHEDMPQPETVEDVDDSNIEIRARRTKKRNEHQKKMTCTNIRKIRLTAAQIRSEVDPLFQSQAKKYDEGGTAELRLNNLKLLDKKYELLLDFESIVSTRCNDYDDSDESDELFNMSEFGSMFQDLTTKTIPILKGYEDFKFTGWNPITDTTNSETHNSYANPTYKDESITEDNYDHVGDYHMDDDDYAMEAPNMKSNEVHESQKLEDDEVDDNMLTIGSSKYENGSNLFVSSVKEMVNSYMENYGEINDNILGMWAGPEHWKEKAKPIRVITTNCDKQRVAKPIRVKEVPPMFPEWVPSMMNSRRIGRLVDIKYEDAETRNNKVSTQLTDDCLNKNIKKEYILPARVPFVFKSINQLMNRDISLVNKALKKHAEQMSSAAMDDEQQPNGEKSAANDVFEVIPKEMIVIDDEGNLSNNFDRGDDGDAYYSDDDPYTGNSLRNCDFHDYGDDDPMAGNIRTVNTIDINYAKTAKRFNVKKLKQEILSYLTDKIHIMSIHDVEDKKFPDIHMSKDKCSLSDLLVTVDKNVTKDVSKELSVSILMTCLLHLANEMGLDIVNVVDFSDFMLGQGFSEYDLEQISLFGMGKDTRKRKSTEIRNTGSKRASKLSSFNDVSDSE